MAPDSPSGPHLRLLLIEDSADDALLLIHRFRSGGYLLDVQRVDTPAQTEAALRSHTWDVVISDHDLPGFSAIAALGIIKQLELDIPFIIVSGAIREETAISAMRAGAHDYLSKNRLERLLPAVERELREAENRRQRRQALAAQHEADTRFQAVAASTPGVIFQMTRLGDGQLAFAYASDATEMLLGVSVRQLCDDSACFSRLLLEDDRAALDAALVASATSGARLNWEGRIHTEAGDTKWINVRGSVRYDAARQAIWEGVMWNITHSKQTESELRASQAHLKALSNHLQFAKEDERERIARDVHDVLGGHLVALKFSASLMASRLDAPIDQLRSQVTSIETLIDEAIDTVSRVTRELRPGILKDFGLAAAIESHAEDFAKRTGIQCEVLCADDDIALPEAESIALFRIFQESLTNVSKHAKAQHVEIRLIHTGDGVSLEVGDDGVGLGHADLAKPHSFGLRGIRERVTSLGGCVDIGNRIPRGTRLQVVLPLPAPLSTLAPQEPSA
ncbi:hybrid sensor histidine kinase/response regulator [Denitromonas iodatirespirans]|uniref:Response regulator n=1 Tax=Denitromonas iodatirespirans TaxID=2795389 RepID=A0A944D843_DENI1|nr:histidine kinase [Denitromonas iodatirespirans]MBT0961709.1 response regulator [Denitromonas iodatirespirans]